MTRNFDPRQFPVRSSRDVVRRADGEPSSAQYVALEASPAAAAQGDLQTSLRHLWQRKWIVLLSTFAGGVLAYAVCSALPPQYTSEARVLVGLQGPRVMNVEAVIADVSPDAERVQNEGYVLQSRSIAGQVIDELNLDRNPLFNPELATPSRFWSDVSPARIEEALPQWISVWLDELRPPAKAAVPPTESQRRNRLIDYLLSKVDVASLGRSHVLSVKAEARDPELAAAIANAFAQKYLEFQRRDKIQTMERVDAFLMQRVEELREQVKKSDQEVQDYRRAHGLYKSGSGTVTTQQLSELNSQLLAAQTARAESESRLAEAQTPRQGGRLDGDTVPEVLRSSLISALKGQLADAERRAADMQSLYGDRHPQLRGVRAEAGSLSARINSETAKIVDGLSRDARTAKARHDALLQQFETLKTGVGAVNEKSIQLEALERDALVNRNLLEAVLNRVKQSTGSTNVLQANARLVSAAVPSEVTSFPPKALIVILASFLALLVGAAVVLLREGADRTFRLPEQIEAMTGVRVLAMVPQVKSRKAANMVQVDPASPYSEAMRRLFLGVELSDVAHPPKTLLVSSATPAEGKSVMVTSLARQLVASGKRVIIIDADWRRPRIHTLARCPATPGLAELLSDSDTVLNDCVHRDALSQAEIIPAGAWDAGASHLLNSRRMAVLLELLSQSYDVILIDTPPALATSDALALSQVVDKVIYVVRWGHTGQHVALDGLKQFVDARADIAGVVVSRVQTGAYRRYAYREISYARTPVPSFR